MAVVYTKQFSKASRKKVLAMLRGIIKNNPNITKDGAVRDLTRAVQDRYDYVSPRIIRQVVDEKYHEYCLKYDGKPHIGRKIAKGLGTAAAVAGGLYIAGKLAKSAGYTGPSKAVQKAPVKDFLPGTISKGINLEKKLVAVKAK